MGNPDIAEGGLPQSGMIRTKYRQKDLELQVEVTLTVGGREDVVLRLLSSSTAFPLEKIHLSQGTTRSSRR